MEQGVWRKPVGQFDQNAYSAAFPTFSHAVPGSDLLAELNFAQFQAAALDFCVSSHSVPTALAALSTADSKRASLATL